MHDIICVTVYSQGFREIGEMWENRMGSIGLVFGGVSVFVLHTLLWVYIGACENLRRRRRCKKRPVFQVRVKLLCFHPKKDVVIHNYFIHLTCGPFYSRPFFFIQIFGETLMDISRVR